MFVLQFQNSWGEPDTRFLLPVANIEFNCRTKKEISQHNTSNTDLNQVRDTVELILITWL